MHALALPALLGSPELPADARARLRQDLGRAATGLSVRAEASAGPLAVKGLAGSARGEMDMYWGSAYNAFSQASFLFLAGHFLDEPRHTRAGMAQLDWVLGANALDRSLVVGWGERCVQKPYHWAYASQLKALPGWISGGPNHSTQGADGMLIDLIQSGTPAELCWLDGTNSWASNEGATDGEAALVFASGWMTAMGDEDADGKGLGQGQPKR
jgi:endoglucanase